MVINRMLHQLSDKPIIGIIAGFSGTFFASIKTFMGDDGVLDMVRILGLWLGFMIAILTGLIKIIELLRIVRGNKKT